MLKPAFQLNLNEKIQRAQATIGKYDGKHPALTCATVAGKIFVHNPHQQSISDSNITFLNINKHICSVVAGQLLQSSSRDVLFVGTPSNLQCYDVENNKDIFFKDFSDGVNTIVVGQFGDIDQPVVIVGGNCSIQVCTTSNVV
jgi:Bardet-Biedl syndrome 2 protein